MKHKYELEYEGDEFAAIMGMINNFVDRTMEVAQTCMEYRAEENRHEIKREKKAKSMDRLKDVVETMTDRLEELSAQIEEVKFESKTQSNQCDKIVDELQKMEDRMDFMNDKEHN
jgi:septal ring factor EnvC (AmiA/AmiB activator)